MIGYAHYYKSADLIGDGSCVFRRLSKKPLEDNSRFLQYVNGTLEELTPEDFGYVNELPPYTGYILTNDDSLARVEIPDTVEKIGQYSFYNQSLTEIIFPANITTIGKAVCYVVGENCVVDFSKAKKVPTLETTEDGTYNPFNSGNITAIKVPSALYNTWANDANWSYLASKIVSV